MTKNKKNRKNVNPPSKSYKTYFPPKITISFRKVSVNSPHLRLKISSGALKPFLGFLKCDSKICVGNDSKADLILSPLSGAMMPCSVSYLTNGSSSLPLIDPFAPEPSSGNCRASKRLDLQGHRDSGAGSTECSTSEQSDLPSSAIVNVVPSLGVKSSVGDMLVEVSSEAPEFGIPCSHVADVCSPSPPESSSILPHIDFASNPPHAKNKKNRKIVNPPKSILRTKLEDMYLRCKSNYGTVCNFGWLSSDIKDSLSKSMEYMDYLFNNEPVSEAILREFLVIDDALSSHIRTEMKISVSTFPSSIAVIPFSGPSSSSVPVISFDASSSRAPVISVSAFPSSSVPAIENEKADIIHTSSLADMSKLKSTLSHLAAVFVPSVLPSSIPMDSSQIYNNMSPIPLPESLVAEDFPRLVLTDHEVSLMRSINSTVGLLAMESSEIYDAIHEICLIADTIRCGDSTLSLYYDVLRDLIIGVLNLLGDEGYTNKEIIDYITLRIVDIMASNSLLTKNQIAEAIRAMTVVHRRQAAYRALRRKESLRLKTKRSDNYSFSYSDVLSVIPPKLSSSSLSSSAPINHSHYVAESNVPPTVAESNVSPTAAQSIVPPTVAESNVSPTAAQSIVPPTVAESNVSPTAAQSIVPPTVAESNVSPTAAQSIVPPTVAESNVSPTAAQSIVPPTVAESNVSPTAAQSIVPPTVAESNVSPTAAQSIVPPTVAESNVSPTAAQSIVPPTVAESNVSPICCQSLFLLACLLLLPSLLFLLLLLSPMYLLLLPSLLFLLLLLSPMYLLLLPSLLFLLLLLSPMYLLLLPSLLFLLLLLSPMYLLLLPSLLFLLPLLMYLLLLPSLLFLLLLLSMLQPVAPLHL